MKIRLGLWVFLVFNFSSAIGDKKSDRRYLSQQVQYDDDDDDKAYVKPNPSYPSYAEQSFVKSNEQPAGYISDSPEYSQPLYKNPDTYYATAKYPNRQLSKYEPPRSYFQIYQAPEEEKAQYASQEHVDHQPRPYHHQSAKYEPQDDLQYSQGPIDKPGKALSIHHGYSQPQSSYFNLKTPETTHNAPGSYASQPIYEEEKRPVHVISEPYAPKANPIYDTPQYPKYESYPSKLDRPQYKAKAPEPSYKDGPYLSKDKDAYDYKSPDYSSEADGSYLHKPSYESKQKDSYEDRPHKPAYPIKPTRDPKLPLYFTMYEKRVISDPVNKYGKGPWRYLTYGHGITYGSKEPGKVFERGYGYIRALGRDHCKQPDNLCPNKDDEKPFVYEGRKEPYFGYRPH